MAARLSFDERARIEAMAATGVAVGEIAGRLGRHLTTVYRELKRAGCGRGRWGDYNAEAAQRGAEQAARRPKRAKLAVLPGIAGKVQELLAMRWSPHAIAAELRREGSPAGRRVCAETIYRACYDHTGGSGLPEGCWRKLPRRCRRRKPRSRAARTPGALRQVRGISERPAAAAERSEPGH